jgi:hypothetical protein
MLQGCLGARPGGVSSGKGFELGTKVVTLEDVVFTESAQDPTAVDRIHIDEPRVFELLQCVPYWRPTHPKSLRQVHFRQDGARRELAGEDQLVQLR